MQFRRDQAPGNRTGAYGDVLGLPGLPGLLVFSAVSRVPHAAAGAVLTLYVVLGLHRGYGAAGLVTAAWTVGAAVGGPWRGRLLDRLGVRRAVLPAVVVEGVGWLLVAPAGSLGLAALAGLAVLIGLFALPIFNVVRLSLSVRVPRERQSTAFSLESIGAELSYMAGPALGVVLATAWSPTGAVAVCGGATVLSGLALLALDPPIRRTAGPDGPPVDAPREHGARGVLTRPVLAVLVSVALASAILAGTELGVVAHLRDGGRPGLAAPVLVAWAAASIAGALLIGALRRPVPLPVLLVALGLATTPLGLAPADAWLALAIVPAGLFCAPTLTAASFGLSHRVPDAVRGEAIGWFGTASTVGAAAGAPVTGLVIDGVGAWAGFALIGGLGACVAGLAWLLID